MLIGKKGHLPREEWDLEKLRQQAKKSATPSVKGTDMKGVREEPYFDIPVSNFIWPLLYTLIGVGNNILTHLIKYADSEIQHVPVR